MDETSVIDTFNLCWDAILNESRQFNCSFLNEGHCKIIDSRDTNFNKVECRLAYGYKFGCFNIHYVEKCISGFLIEYSESETVFPLENLKVCSLSNGPGFDIIGLLCALYKSKKSLKCFPQLKAINFYDSWLNMYKAVVRKTYEVISLKSFFEYFHIPSENIHLIQSDIYATMSPEAEKIISDSNVLLMVKVFVSTKATPDTFANTLKKIFSLVKPGTLIFFVGTKHNARNFSKNSSLSSAVKCIFGPQKVTLNNLPFNESILNILNVKPQDSGYAYFIVWQKREVDVTLEVSKNMKKRTRRKKKKTLKPMEKHNDNDSIVDEILDDTDAGSEISFTSCSKQSDSLSDELKSGSLANISGEVNGDSSEREAQNLSQSSIIHSLSSISSISDRTEIEDLNVDEVNVKCSQPSMHQSVNDNESNNLESNIQGKELEAVGMTNDMKSQTLKEMYPLKEANMEQRKNAVTTQNEISQNVVAQFLKECSVDKVNASHLSTETSFANGMYQTVFPPFVQSKVYKVDANTPSKNKIKSVEVLPSELNAEVKNDKKLSKTTLQDNSSSVNQSCENVFKFPRNVIDLQHSSDRNSHDVQRLIQRCDSLITSLEKMAADIKRNVSSKNDQSFIKKSCCASEVCSKFQVPHCCCCSNNIIQSCCCKKTCKCNTIKNICTTCTSSFSYRSNIKEAHECFETRRSADPSRPYIVVPL